jgi:hypothetical protein
MYNLDSCRPKIFILYQDLQRFFHTSTPNWDKDQKILVDQANPEIPPPVDDQPETLFQKFKAMYKKYWYILLPVHIVTSVMWVAGFYLLAKAGLDLVLLLEKCHAPEVLMNPIRNSNAGYYAIAYACYKLVAPVRYAVTIGGTTLLIRYLTRFGYLKPIPSKQQIMAKLTERRDNFASRQNSWRKRLTEFARRLRVKENMKLKKKL